MPTSLKNMSLSAASNDLGLGDLLRQQSEDQINERKKKMLQTGANQSLMQNALMPASSLLFLPPGGA